MAWVFQESAILGISVPLAFQIGIAREGPGHEPGGLLTDQIHHMVPMGLCNDRHQGIDIQILDSVGSLARGFSSLH